MFNLTLKTKILIPQDATHSPTLRHTLRILQRDVRRALGFKPLAAKARGDSNLILEICPLEGGAGTVVTAEQARIAIECGSQFGLAPGTDPETIRYFNEHEVPFVPGVMTPSDIQAALKLGCRHLKFFPAGPAGGPSLLRAMAAP